MKSKFATYKIKLKAALIKIKAYHLLHNYISEKAMEELLIGIDKEKEAAIYKIKSSEGDTR
jgi:hypothetical protein